MVSKKNFDHYFFYYSIISIEMPTTIYDFLEALQFVEHDLNFIN